MAMPNGSVRGTTKLYKQRQERERQKIRVIFVTTLPHRRNGFLRDVRKGFPSVTLDFLEQILLLVFQLYNIAWVVLSPTLYITSLPNPALCNPGGLIFFSVLFGRMQMIKATGVRLVE
jgi:hypothetical protein